MTKNAILCFVVKNSKILLIDKKTGFGKGKINGPGGKIWIGETPEKAAIRELQEEIGVKPLTPKIFGELDFHYSGDPDNPDWKVFVLKSEDFEGEPKETADASPLWVSIDKIPYEKMWHDDSFWMPLLLKNKEFKGKFSFDKEMNKVTAHKLEVV